MRVHSHPSGDGKSTIVAVHGRLDLGLAAPFWQVLAAADAARPCYVVDLAAAQDVRDSGLALLLMLERRARQQGGRLQLANCTPELGRRWATLATAPAARAQ